MCGRYALTADVDLLVELFELANADQLQLEPRYNAAPTQMLPIVRFSRSGQERRMETMQWGLVPWFAKDPSIGSRMINARAESAADKPAYRQAMQRRRCLVPADGFFEWKEITGRKFPYLVKLASGQPMALAGLWELWKGTGQRPVRSFTILTTEPNELTGQLHDRMPVVIRCEDFERWLDPRIDDAAALRPLLKPLPADLMTMHPVSRRVNDPANDDPSVLEPAPEPPEEEQPGLF